jgi:hypothetical protein
MLNESCLPKMLLSVYKGKACSTFVRLLSLCAQVSNSWANFNNTCVIQVERATMSLPAPSNPRMLFSYVALFALWGLTQVVLVSLSFL